MVCDDEDSRALEFLAVAATDPEGAQQTQPAQVEPGQPVDSLLDPEFGPFSTSLEALCNTGTLAASRSDRIPASTNAKPVARIRQPREASCVKRPGLAANESSEGVSRAMKSVAFQYNTAVCRPDRTPDRRIRFSIGRVWGVTVRVSLTGCQLFGCHLFTRPTPSLQFETLKSTAGRKPSNNEWKPWIRTDIPAGKAANRRPSSSVATPSGSRTWSRWRAAKSRRRSTTTPGIGRG